MTIYKTCESVCIGHPDKLCDLIADSILDECLRLDKSSRIACEVMATGHKIIVAGEITCSKRVDIRFITRQALRKAGYNPLYYLVYVFVHKQSEDIDGGVSRALESRNGDTSWYSTIGAGDQGTVYGYATNETKSLIPLPLELAHQICKRLDKVRSDGTIKGIFSGGKAKNFKKLNSVSGEQIAVTMSAPDSMYLKGFTGDIYTGRGWEELSAAKRHESSELFYWLFKSGFNPLTQLSFLDRAVNNSAPVNVINIRSISASPEYAYVPYELADASDSGFDTRQSAPQRVYTKGLFGQREYTYKASPGITGRYTELLPALYEDSEKQTPAVREYIQLQANYSDYVYSSYLDGPIPESLKKALPKYNPETEKHVSYTAAKNAIARYLSENMTYDPDFEGDKSGPEQDFVKDFIENTKTGNSMHFASAAVLMFRAMGIPARYSEGYIITPEDAQNMQADTPFTIDGSRAHVWAEYYRDGVGFVPFEATPAYMGIMEAPDEIAARYGLGYDSVEEIPRRRTQNDKDIQEDTGVQGLVMQHIKAAARAAAYLAAAALLLTVFAAAAVILKRRTRLMRMHKDFEQADPKEAVIKMFGYVFDLLEHEGIIENRNALDDNALELKESLSQEYYSLFKEVKKIFELAVFSKHEITNEQRKTAKQLVDATVKAVKEKASKQKTFQNRYVRYLYK